MVETVLVPITEPRSDDGSAIADIHLAARREAMPWLARPHTDEGTQTYFAQAIRNRPRALWVIRQVDQVAAYMLIDRENLDHLYVSPAWQGHGFGSALLDKAKVLSPRRLQLWTFQRNDKARAFYEARGFSSIKQTDGENEEGEPDVLYEWLISA